MTAALKYKPAQRRAEYEEVIAVVADHFNISRADILSRNLMDYATWPRQIAMALCRETPGASTTSIGNTFDRHYSTVIFATQKVGALDEFDKLKRDLAEIRLKIAALHSGERAEGVNEIITEPGT